MWSRCFPSNVKELFSFRIPSPVLNTSEGCLHKNHFRTKSSCWPLLPLGILWYAPATLALCSLFPKELYCHCSNIRGARLESCCWPSPPVGSLWPALENTGSPGFPSYGTAVIRGSECCSNCWCELRVANGICRPDKLFCPGTLLFATTDNFDSGCAHFLASGESGPLPLLQLHRRHRVELSNRDAKGKRHHELVVVTLLSVGAVSKLFGILGLEEGKNGKVRRDWIAPGCAQAASGRWCPALSFCSRTLLGGILEISNWQVDSPDCRSMRPYIQIAGRVHSSSACGALIGTEEKGQSPSLLVHFSVWAVAVSFPVSTELSQKPNYVFLGPWNTSPEVIYVQGLWASHSGMILPFVHSQAHFSFQHSHCWDPPVTPEIQRILAPAYLDGIRVLCAPVAVKAFCLCQAIGSTQSNRSDYPFPPPGRRQGPKIKSLVFSWHRHQYSVCKFIAVTLKKVGHT